jgi:hypothetical protein
MGAIEDHNIYGLTVRESATDGSDFSNAPADYRRLFLGEDGQLHVKDSAGAVPDIGSGSGIPPTLFDAAGDIIVASAADTAARLAKGAAGGALSIIDGAVAWNSGTSFPGSPDAGDRFYRTDIRGGMEFIFDGTRWVSAILFNWTPSAAVGVSADTSKQYLPLPTDLQILVHSWDVSMYVSGSATWVATLETGDFETDVGSVIASKSTVSQTAAKMYSYTEAIGAVVNGTGGNVANALTTLAFWFDEQAGTATLFGGANINYRLIAT